MRRRPHAEEDAPGGTEGTERLLRLMLTRRELSRDPSQATNLAKIAAQIPVALGHVAASVAVGSDGRPLLGAGLDGARVLRVFTDDEAFAAWTVGRPDGEPPAASLVV